MGFFYGNFYELNLIVNNFVQNFNRKYHSIIEMQALWKVSGKLDRYQLHLLEIILLVTFHCSLSSI